MSRKSLVIQRPIRKTNRSIFAALRKTICARDLDTWNSILDDEAKEINAATMLQTSCGRQNSLLLLLLKDVAATQRMLPFHITTIFSLINNGTNLYDPEVLDIVFRLVTNRPSSAFLEIFFLILKLTDPNSLDAFLECHSFLAYFTDSNLNLLTRILDFYKGRGVSLGVPVLVNGLQHFILTRSRKLLTAVLDSLEVEVYNACVEQFADSAFLVRFAERWRRCDYFGPYSSSFAFVRFIDTLQDDILRPLFITPFGTTSETMFLITSLWRLRFNEDVHDGHFVYGMKFARDFQAKLLGRCKPWILRSMWILESPNIENGLQWLPNEMMEDLLAFL